MKGNEGNVRAILVRRRKRTQTVCIVCNSNLVRRSIFGLLSLCNVKGMARETFGSGTTKCGSGNVVKCVNYCLVLVPISAVSQNIPLGIM